MYCTGILCMYVQARRRDGEQKGLSEDFATISSKGLHLSFAFQFQTSGPEHKHKLSSSDVSTY
jgi:hypothetical protein